MAEYMFEYMTKSTYCRIWKSALKLGCSVRKTASDGITILRSNYTNTAVKLGINTGPPEIKVYGGILEVVEHFPCLGSELSQKTTIEVEIQQRICCASTSFRKLRHRVFDGHNLRKEANVVV